MKSTLIIFSVGIVTLLSSCNNASEKKILKTEKAFEEKEEIAVIPNNTLSVEISGMTCEHGCGGSIRSALKEIKFDDKKISQDELIAVIEKIHDGQYKTGKVTSEK
jgi:hypothetical protein